MYKLLFLVSLLFVLSNAKTAQAYSAASALVADVNSGYLFTKENIDVPLHPASLTKVMTLYLTFSALEEGLLKMDDALPISEWAAAQEPSKLSLVAGETITVREAILALIVKSANDVAVVLAETLAPTEAIFADMMTQAAAQLGMSRTVFKNASGLHHPDQLTCAQDMAILTLATIKNFPQYYPLFATQSFTYKGREYNTHNHILTDYEGAEGFKTGYIAAAGYNIISTANKENHRLVSIVLGHSSAKERDDYAKSLLDFGFEKVQKQKNALQQGLLQPAFDPLQRKAMVGKLNMNVFTPMMKMRTKQVLAQAKKAKQTAQSIHDTMHQITFTQNPDYMWTIQIGAFGTQEKALSMANKAMSVLNINQCAVQIQKKDNQLYRSRLTGFQTKQMAEAACDTLNNNHHACFVVIPQGDK